jgi:hypothetical protein
MARTSNLAGPLSNGADYFRERQSVSLGPAQAVSCRASVASACMSADHSGTELVEGVQDLVRFGTRAVVGVDVGPSQSSEQGPQPSGCVATPGVAYRHVTQVRPSSTRHGRASHPCCSVGQLSRWWTLPFQ